MHVKPTKDPTRAVVINPYTRRRIPADGITVPDVDVEFLRMISHGDLIRTDTPVTSGGTNSAVTSGGAVVSGGTVSSGGSVSSGASVSSGGAAVSSGSGAQA